MPALSPVVQPRHVELRQAIPLLNIKDQSSAFQENSVIVVRPSSLPQKFFELMSWPTKDKSLLEHV